MKNPFQHYNFHSRPRSTFTVRTPGAHDADLAKLVGRTNVHIFLVPR